MNRDLSLLNRAAGCATTRSGASAVAPSTGTKYPASARASPASPTHRSTRSGETRDGHVGPHGAPTGARQSSQGRRSAESITRSPSARAA